MPTLVKMKANSIKEKKHFNNTDQTPYLSKVVCTVHPRSMDQEGMEEHSVPCLHVQMNTRLTRVIVLDAMVHLVYASLQNPIRTKYIFSFGVCVCVCVCVCVRACVCVWSRGDNNNNCISRWNSRFFTISSLRLEPSPTRTLKWPGHCCAQIMCNITSAYHMPHVVLHATWYEGTAQLLSLTKCKSHLF